MNDGTHVSGVLYAVDPESGDIAMIQPQDGSLPTIKIVLGHQAQSIEADDGGDSANALSSMRESVNTMDMEGAGRVSSEREHQELQLFTDFLEEHFVPFAIDESDKSTVVVFGGAARLRSPFDPAAIECANEQILSRLHALVTKFHEAMAPSLEL
ncbi:hypothetical protein P43SY_000327 [Pythium insidiosum]|uniref:AD domain-containing protein n=1 Tax=Pythium insidiosum TaxID=114742 RepID=A0AAD5LT71_PYTIN|nr:hypothetical protein P43SY_000327 [Pythium insidiosum]